MKTTDIYVATHKKTMLDLPDHCSMIQVNACNNGQWDGYLHDDDDADNISRKNNSYCELTALYALWKNSPAQIGGLFHYRRFLSGMRDVSLLNESNRILSRNEVGKFIISEDEIARMLETSDVILPLPDAPFPLYVFEDLQKFVYMDDIWKLINCIDENYPDYSEDLWQILMSTNMSYCNMFVAKRDFINEYCEWLFDVLETIEPDIPLGEYDTDHQRIFGYYAEILLNVFISHKRKIVTYVYKVDLFEGDERSLKYRVKRFVNRCLSGAGQYPLGYPRKLNEARYKVLTGERDPVPSVGGMDYENAKRRIRSFIESSGGLDIVTEEKDEYCAIKGTYYDSNLYYFVCETKEGLSEAVKKAEGLRDRTMGFGRVNAVRLVCCEPVDHQLSEELKRKGMIVVVNGGR